jgi:PAS domain S-box-containing protein
MMQWPIEGFPNRAQKVDAGGNMARKKSRPEKVGLLGRKAKKVQTEKQQSSLKELSQDTQKLIQELEVHQTELEMQNEELRRAQLELGEARNKYEDLYDFAPVGYFALGREGRIVEVNQAGAQLLGEAKSHLRNKPFRRFILPEFLNHFDLYQQQVFQGGKNPDLEIKLKSRDAIPFHVSLRCVAHQEEEGPFTQVRCVVTDITEHKRMEEEIRKSRDELQRRTADLVRANELFQAELSQRRRAEDSLRESEKRLRHLSYQLLNAQESERKRIARELHDGIGQSLTAIKFTLERKLGLMKKEKPPTGITLEDIVLMTQNTIQENRRIMTNLRPAVLDDLGILATLSWFLREFQNAFPHLKVEQQIAIREEEVADPLKTIIFRVLQEAMNNFSTHSKGDRVAVALRKTSGAIELMIQDNGTGFDLMKVQKGLGLSSMEERVDLSGGAFGIESAPGKGTRIRATWPLQK